jgi:hypothetical protein
MFWDAAAPALKAVSIAYVPKSRICLPYNSDIGAHNKGPMANPRTKTDSPSIATSELTLKSSIIWSEPLAKAEETKATANVT